MGTIRYRGHNGQVETTGHEVVLTREGFIARLSFRGAEPRRIPLQDVVGVRYREPVGLANGWLQILVDRDTPELGMTAAVSDPDTVIFTRAKRKQFAELYEYLRDVAGQNELR